MKKFIKQPKILTRNTDSWITDKLSEIKQNIKDLSGVAIENKVSDEDINTLRDQIKQLQKFIGPKGTETFPDVVSELNKLISQLDQLETDVEKNISDISTLKPKVDANTNTNTQQESKITNNESRITTLEDELRSQTTDDCKLIGFSGEITTTETQVRVSDIEIPFDSNESIEIELDADGKPTGFGIIKEDMNIVLTAKSALEVSAIFNDLVDITLRITDGVEVLSEETQNFSFSVFSQLDNQSIQITTKYRGIDIKDPSTYKKVGLTAQTNYAGGVNTSNVKFFLTYTTIGSTLVITNFADLNNDTNVLGTSGKEVINNLNDSIKQNKQDISDMKLIFDMLIPIGTIQLGTTAPTYGTWTDLGTLAEGQAIIGGSDSDGVVRRHSHQWARGGIYQNLDSKNEEKALIQLQTYDSKGNNYDTPYHGSGGSDGTYGFNAYTDLDIWQDGFKKTEDYNKAYGKGIGLTIHLWKRTA